MTTIFVPGTPAPQGSARAFVRGGRPIITHANEKTMPWRADIAAHMRSTIGPNIEFPEDAVKVALLFVMPRRAAEPKRVTPNHTRKPDIDKLIRSTLDALTGISFTDDAQVTFIGAHKRTAKIGEQPGVHICVERPELSA